jgi:dipeptidase
MHATARSIPVVVLLTLLLLVPPPGGARHESGGHALSPAGFPAEAGQANGQGDGCTMIGVGRQATTDGSVITSHSDACSECRVHVVPGRRFPGGAKAPVHWGMIYYGRDDERGGRPLGDYGKVIAHIPQVERTYTYFHTGYSQFNEHQLAIAESTCSQKRELATPYVEDVTEQVMTVEQAMVFALERTRTAREAVKLIGSLMETWGFLPSTGGSEALAIADPKELWVQEIFSVGSEWKRASRKPGAIWAAQRVPDGHVTVVPNYVRIREIDPQSADFLVSPNYMQAAVEHGWYDPAGGKPFIWQEAYAPPIGEGSLNRLWLIYSSLAPSLKAWPDRRLDASGKAPAPPEPFEGAHFYPFSFQPERQVSVQDVIGFQRAVFDGTVYDMTADAAWQVKDVRGGTSRSGLASPFASPELRRLLGVRGHRMIPNHGYGMVAQLRGWLPDPIGGVYWFYVDNPYVSTYVPIYAGVREISRAYQTYDARQFSEGSARWAVDFVDNLLHLRWQDAVKDLRAARDPIESEFFASQAAIEEQALALHTKSPAAAEKFLTDLTKARMERVVAMYRDLRGRLITKYTNSTY